MQQADVADAGEATGVAGVADVADVAGPADAVAMAAVVADAAPRRTLRLGGRAYPLILPRLRDSRLHVAAVTISIHVLGQLWLNFQLSVPQILASILTCAVIEVAVTFRTTRSFVWPASAMLTGSGVALILRVPTTPLHDHWTFHKWYLYAGVGAFSLATKYFIRHRGSPIFNPSNVGLVATFIVLGSSRAEPLDFWWAPLHRWMILAYVVILGGGMLITGRLRLLAGAAAFWVTLAAGMGLLAASDHCMTARWAFAPVCGGDYWRAIVTSPEVLIFMFFMITDPKTVPRGRVSHVVFCVLVAVVCIFLMAPQTTEFWSKVGLLGGLTAMCVLRPLLQRLLPEPGSSGDGLRPFLRRIDGVRIALLSIVLVALGGGVVLAGSSSRGAAVPQTSDILGRALEEVDPSTLPSITIDQGVLDWNHEIAGEGAKAIVLTLVENLEVENQALLRSDASLLAAVDHGDRLDAMRQRLTDSTASGTTVIERYQIDRVHITLIVPFGKQDGLSLGLQSSGKATTETYDAAGNLLSRTSAPFSTTFAVRRATGGRWLNVAELPPEQFG